MIPLARYSYGGTRNPLRRSRLREMLEFAIDRHPQLVRK